ncbi:unnamed protein product [Rotaria sordida]|uniref:CDP-diacylglycerol--inositol 3-phosphatidyltransferase n=1 Tax=Rotaria sordida TaxID=392033 RepID=A0A813SXN0_9BILA|nr:unnamed protein product [Rotaria sordida]CAF0741013.1 unnamed protein product [Rotaria sordida]CAF0753111.1 unnamed protein product [Rotaria sordida]CAF0802243.1 unnamed protein product [Rotaria sordida]CAF4007702.1 unnamed protein product [Rotaria sordida]
MTSFNITNINANGWLVLFNAPNTLCWIRIVLMFVSIQRFGQRNYLLFIIYHTVSGFLDSLDGILARNLNQISLVGRYFELILDSYAHFIMYACVGLLYPSYIVYFYIEIALELWSIMLDYHINRLPKSDLSWLHKTTFLSTTCSVSIYHHPNLRLLNWYGPDIFHTLLVLRYILINDSNKKLIRYIQRYITLNKIYLLIKITLLFTGFFSILRTSVTSCFLLDKLYRMARVK